VRLRRALRSPARDATAEAAARALEADGVPDGEARV
jgi:hypothetical protein